jgi:hypothetical protein
LCDCRLNMGICSVIAGKNHREGPTLGWESGKLRIHDEPERTLRRGVIGAMVSRARQRRFVICGAGQVRFPWAGLAWEWVTVAG